MDNCLQLFKHFLCFIIMPTCLKSIWGVNAINSMIPISHDRELQPIQVQ